MPHRSSTRRERQPLFETAVCNVKELQVIYGTIKGAIEAYTGKDLLTGAELGVLDRAVNAACAVASAAGAIAKTAGGAVRFGKVINASDDIVRDT